MYDVVIIGAGAAGLSAGIFTSRRKLKTLIVSKEVGGQTASTLEIENYPGITKITGPDLINIFHEQATTFGCEFAEGTPTEIKKTKKGFSLKLNKKKIETHALILAFGKTPRTLEVPQEDEWCKKGLLYSTTGDLKKFKNKEIAIIGGGSAALEDCLLLSKYAKKIRLIHRRKSFRAEEVLQEKVKKLKNIIYHLESLPLKLEGKEKLESLAIVHLPTKKPARIKADYCVARIGYEMNTECIKDLVKRDKEKRIKIDINAHTSTEGIFAAGDVTNVAYQQIAISAGDGAKAGLSAYQYVQKKRGRSVEHTDWGYLS